MPNFTAWTKNRKFFSLRGKWICSNFFGHGYYLLFHCGRAKRDLTIRFSEFRYVRKCGLCSCSTTAFGPHLRSWGGRPLLDIYCLASLDHNEIVPNNHVDPKNLEQINFHRRPKNFLFFVHQVKFVTKAKNTLHYKNSSYITFNWKCLCWEIFVILARFARKHISAEMSVSNV